MQTNCDPIKIILNLMNSDLIINIADFILLQLCNLNFLDSFPLILCLLQLALQNLEDAAIVRMVMDPTALIHIPRDNMQIENLIGEYVFADIVVGIQFDVRLPVGSRILAQEGQVLDNVGLPVFIGEREQSGFQGLQGGDRRAGKIVRRRRFIRGTSCLGERVLSAHFSMAILRFKCYLGMLVTIKRFFSFV